MSNLIKYNLGVVACGIGDYKDMVVDAEGEYVKFDDIKELLNSSPNCQSDAISQLYHELLYAVTKKFPNETRHQTALRYIQQAEQFDNGGVAKQAHV